MNKRSAVVLIGVAVIVSVTFSVIAEARSLTTLENVLLQVFSIGISIVGSFVFGRESAKDAAAQMIKPHARSAFRRLLSLYKSLSRLAYAIQAARPVATQHAPSIAILERLEAIVTEQIATADDALQDWNDIVPDEVAQLRESARTATAQGVPNEH